MNQSMPDSSSHQDLDGSVNGDDSRLSVEPEELESEDQSNSSRRNSSYTDSKPTTLQKESLEVSLEGRKQKDTNSWKSVLAGAFVVAFVAVAVVYLVKSPPAKRPQHCDQFVTELRPKYPTIDPMLWVTLNVSVNRAVYRKPGEPATFMFLYDSTTVQKDLVEDIVGITSKCFDSPQPIRLTSADFETPDIAADYSAFLQRYKQPLEERSIMVVQDLDQVPAKAARAFFTICDAYGPLVERAVIFFTIDISQRVADLGQSPTELAEELLEDQWRNGLNGDTLVPLLVRLTENVFKIM